MLRAECFRHIFFLLSPFMYMLLVSWHSCIKSIHIYIAKREDSFEYHVLYIHYMNVCTSSWAKPIDRPNDNHMMLQQSTIWYFKHSIMKDNKKMDYNSSIQHLSQYAVFLWFTVLNYAFASLLCCNRNLGCSIHN